MDEVVPKPVNINVIKSILSEIIEWLQLLFIVWKADTIAILSLGYSMAGAKTLLFLSFIISPGIIPFSNWSSRAWYETDALIAVKRLSQF